MLEMLRLKILFGLRQRWKQSMVQVSKILPGAALLILLIPCLEALASNQFTLKCNPKTHFNVGDQEYVDLDRDNFRISFDLDRNKFSVFDNYSGMDVRPYGHDIREVRDDEIIVRYRKFGEGGWYLEKVNRISGTYYHERIVGRHTRFPTGYVKTYDCVKLGHYTPIPEMKTKF